jgi:hypothetical protein
MQRATLAMLLLNSNRVVSVDRLADDLYAGEPPVTAVTQVQRQMSELRKTLGSPSAVETRPPGYAIRLSPDQLDLARFERQVEEGGQAFERGNTRLAAEIGPPDAEYRDRLGDRHVHLFRGVDDARLHADFIRRCACLPRHRERHQVRQGPTAGQTAAEPLAADRLGKPAHDRALHRDGPGGAEGHAVTV